LTAAAPKKGFFESSRSAEVNRGGEGQAMTIAWILSELKRSLVESAGTIVFGMEDGTASIFGLIFGVAATTTSSHVVLIAGAAGAASAAVWYEVFCVKPVGPCQHGQAISASALKADLVDAEEVAAMGRHEPLMPPLV
jgi:hypothetical protein